MTLHFLLTGICYQKSGKIKELLKIRVALRTRHSLFSQMHEGISPSEIVPAEYRKRSCLHTILYIHIHGFSRNKHTLIIISLKSLTYVLSPLHMRCSVPGVFLGIPGGQWPRSHTWPSAELVKFGTTELATFQLLLLQNKHCVVPRASGFWRISIVLAHQVQTIFHLTTHSKNEAKSCSSGWFSNYSPKFPA